MTQADVKRLALVLAVQAEIEGMKAENQYWKNNGGDPTHGESKFLDKASELRNLAYAHDDQL